MSTLLEQAIVDAAALKEAALKSAETAILEKYAPEVKNAIASLLEQDEPLDLEEPEAREEVPLAAAEEAPLCPCPDDEEEIEIDFDQLQAMADELAAGEPASSEMLATEFGAEEEEEEGFDLTEALVEAIESEEDVELEEAVEEEI